MHSEARLQGISIVAMGWSPDNQESREGYVISLEEMGSPGRWCGRPQAARGTSRGGGPSRCPSACRHKSGPPPATSAAPAPTHSQHAPTAPEPPRAPATASLITLLLFLSHAFLIHRIRCVVAASSWLPLSLAYSITTHYNRSQGLLSMTAR